MTVRSSHLVRLKGICQLADQRASLVRSFCNVWWSFGVVMLLKIKTSSAYSLTEDSIPFGRSFMNS